MAKKSASKTPETNDQQQPTTAVAVRPSNYKEFKGTVPALVTQRGLAEMIGEQMGDLGIGTFTLPRIKVPSNGATTWVVPAVDGDTAMKTLECVIVAVKGNEFSWYRDSQITGNKPDCVSHDGVHGYGNRDMNLKLKDGEVAEQSAQLCAECPWHQWGSERKNHRGRDCGERMLLFLAMPDTMLPMLLSVPATSLKPVRKYGRDMMAFGRIASGVVTRLSLRKERIGENDVSIIVPEFAGDLSDQDAAQAKAVGALCAKMIASGLNVAVEAS